MGQPTFRVKQMRPNCNSDGDAYKENSDPDNNILKGDDAVTPHPHVRQKNEYVAYINQKRDHERKLDLSRKNYDENTCSINAPNTSYNEADGDDLNINDHKGLRQSLIMAIEKIQQDSDTNVATLHRKIQDETRDLVKTSSNKITFDDIKCGKTKELSAVDEKAVIYIKCSVVEIIGAICSLIRSKGAKGSHLSWTLSIHISTYPNPKLSNSDKLNFALNARQNERNVLDLEMRPKRSISKLAVAKLTDKVFFDLNLFKSNRF